MNHESDCRIHPTALISPEAELADDVRVGPFTLIEGRVRLGPGCVIGARVSLIGPILMGKNNHVYANTIIGERPQHFGYQDEPTRVEIGEGNTIRENCTVHRGTTHAWVTRIGNGNYFMAGAHIAHDCLVGDKCVFANNALLAGHCTIGDSVFLSGNCGIHQFCRVGRLAFLSGVSASSKDIPPFIMQQGINDVVGVNVVGMRRAGMNSTQINAIRRIYHIVYLQGLSLPNALARVEGELGSIDVVQEYLTFVRQSKRGINGSNAAHLNAAA